MTTGITNQFRVFNAFDLSLFTGKYGGISGNIRYSGSNGFATYSWTISTGSNGSSFFMLPFSASSGSTIPALPNSFNSLENAFSASVAGFSGSTLTFRFNNTNVQWELFIIADAKIAALTASFSPGAIRLLALPTTQSLQLLDDTSAPLTSTIAPWYCWIPSYIGYGMPYSNVYEPTPIFNDRFSDDGFVKFSIGRKGASQFEDWSWSAEPNSNVFIYQSSSINQFVGTYTYQQWLIDTRTVYSFAVVTGSQFISLTGSGYPGIKGIYQLNAEASNFKPKMTMNGYDGAWDLDMKTFVIFRQNSNS